MGLETCDLAQALPRERRETLGELGGAVDDLADAVGAAIRAGKSTPPAPNPAADLERALGRELVQKIPPAARPTVSLCGACRANALRAARQGRHRDAAGWLDLPPRIMVMLNLPAGAALAQASQQAAGRAYVAYKRGDPDEAEHQLTLGTLADAELSGAHGWRAAELHRLHLEVNRSRVRRAAGRLAGAVIVAAAVLERLAGDPSSLPPTGWPAPALNEISALGLAVIEGKATEEVALALTSVRRDDRAALFMPLNRYLDRLGVVRRSRSQVWLAAQRQLVCGDVHGFLRSMCPFLAEGPGFDARLWTLAVADVAELAKSGSVLRTAALAAALDEAAVGRPNSPRHQPARRGVATLEEIRDRVALVEHRWRTDSAFRTTVRADPGGTLKEARLDATGW